MRIVIAIVITAAICVGAAFLLLGNRGAPEDVEEQEVKKEVPVVPPEIFEVGEFLVNVNSADQLRYLRVEVALSVRAYFKDEEEQAGGGHGGGGDKEEGLPKLQASDEAMVRDAIVRVLSDQTYEQLRGDAGHTRLKEKLSAELDEIFAQAEVVDVLFLSFVMQ